ncbi:MAG: carboxylating nicotinate-nucleotide diphosphorylase [Chitinispirillales bacterium]|jgi:nicotinate-nucleotide pyrophosphorylase (carboxylating)|nr:carboxylating nicotinate-nucleotide diphosphorylase [Chitinispirillales bacterium]
MATSNSVINILKNALDEDLGTIGDITSQAIFDCVDMGEAVICSKQAGILSGASLIAPLYELVDSYLLSLKSPAASCPMPTQIALCCSDGDPIGPETVICKIQGSVKSILSGERVILNLLQRLSGIATLTAKMVKELGGGKTRLLDTRKTSPGLRTLEKAAVRHGGGFNHRAGLYDMILIKDTHVKHTGGVKDALAKALAWRGGKITPFIEVEVQSVDEFFEALPLKPDRIMLDNMTPEEIKACVNERNAQGLSTELEASGGISLFTLPAIAATNVDFVSSGAITHSAPALDINLVMV